MKSDRCRYSGYRFAPEIIRYAVWAYPRFCLSFRDVEELLAERGIAWCGSNDLGSAPLPMSSAPTHLSGEQRGKKRSGVPIYRDYDQNPALIQEFKLE